MAYDNRGAAKDNFSLICPNCGTKNHPDLALCIICFYPLTAVAQNQLSAPDQVICPNCGNANPLGSAFCDTCGCPLAAVAQNQLSAPDQWICLNCGHANPLNWVFCGTCGRSLPAITPSNSPTRVVARNLVICPVCGQSKDASEIFCNNCGSPLALLAPSYQSPVQQLTSAVANNNAGDFLISAYLPVNTILRTRYHILEQLGKGGMGAVYKAKDATFNNRFLAVKQMIQSGLAPQMLAVYTDNFQREANLLASLMHPNLPRIYEYFSEGEYWYLVMDYIEGINLQKHLEQSGGRLPVEEALHIGIDLCTVLHYLHTRKPTIIFRDLKPANVMITSEGHLYLIDFGIARQFNPNQQKDTHDFQTPGYAAPEQFNQKQTTPQSDIYSLGATLHQLLSGDDPTDSIFDLPPLQIGIPELAILVASMLEMKPTKRPANMLVVKQELQRILTQVQSGVKPTPPSPWQPGQRDFGYLRIVEGKGSGNVYELRKEFSSIGRTDECDICLVEDLAISRLHVTISKNANGYTVKDEGSANGTKLNGQLISKYNPFPLQENDRLQIGQTTLVFTYQ